jgi:hypothetical protein
MSGLTFGEALRALKQGKRVTRSGWNGPDQWIELQVPDAFSKMRKPYIYMSPVDGEFVPWLASQTDMLAEDWKIAE